MYSATSCIDCIAMVVAAKYSECDKKMSYNNDRRQVGYICDMLTFGSKSFLLKIDTQILLKSLRSKWPGKLLQ